MTELEAIQKALKEHGKDAFNEALNNGGAYIQRGRRIGKVTKDGKFEVIMTLDKAYVKPKKRVYKF